MRLLPFLKARLPPTPFFDRLLLTREFFVGHRRLPRGPLHSLAWPSDIVFHRATSDVWTALERRATDKVTASDVAASLAPNLKFARRYAVIDVPPGATIESLRALLRPYFGLNVVAKAAHSCGGVLYLDKEPSLHDWRFFHQQATTDYYLQSRERQYRGLPKRILVEERLGREPMPLVNYKFRCVRGSARYMNLSIGQDSNRLLGFFEVSSWKGIPFDLPGGAVLADEQRKVVIEAEPPPRLEEMVEIAERLSASFSFVRIDLYSLPDGVYFSEFIFTPSGGRRPMLPSVQSNLELGRAIREAA